MKKISLLLLTFMLLSTIVFAQTPKEIFDSGVILFKKGLYQNAIDTFTKLIEQSPDHADAYKNRGVSYMKLEKFDLAIKDFLTAKKIFPELKGLYSNLGVAWYYKKEYAKAIKNYDIELEMTPENYIAYFNRALCLTELGNNDLALDDLEKTLSLKPDFYWALCYKADLLVQQTKFIKARKTYAEAIKYSLKDTYAKDKLADLVQKIKTKADSSQNGDNLQVSRLTIQTGAFLNQNNAKELKTKLIKMGFDSRILILKDSKDKTWYLVRSGKYINQNKAQKDYLSLKEKLGNQPVIRTIGVW